MQINRREFVAKTSASERRGLGVVIHSFAVRGRDRSFADPMRFLAHAKSLWASGVQVGLGARDDAYIDALKAQANADAMYLEGIVALPADEADAERFETEIRTAKRAGANVVRTVMLSGRRYETFDSASAFQRFAEKSKHSLRIAAPIVEQHDVRLAVENHKDWRADELLKILDEINNDHVGVCLDTGNSIALLEDPMEVVEALAPRAFTTHFKDMALEEYPQGFRLAEVPLGKGILDLDRCVEILHKHSPGIRFNLEMITRDPLDVPCLTERYWATFHDLPGRNLAHTLSLVRAHTPPEPLQHVSSLEHDAKLALEDENNRRCLDYARSVLSL
jgi:3-oxoisoapionate decarboxylase